MFMLLIIYYDIQPLMMEKLHGDEQQNILHNGIMQYQCGIITEILILLQIQYIPMKISLLAMYI